MNTVNNLRLRLARRKLDKAMCAVEASVQCPNITRSVLADIAKDYIHEAREIIKEIEKSGTTDRNHCHPE